MPVDDCGELQQYDERRIPGRVKQVARDEEIGLLRFPIEWRVVQRQHQDEEHDKRE